MSRRSSSLFNAIEQSPNLTSGLVETLVAQISSGELAPGQRLPTEQAIVAATGVSRTVVREALASLRARGLVTTRQGLGTFVADNPAPKSFSIASEDLESLGDTLHVLELRIGIEVEAAGVSALRRKASDIARMEEHLAALEAAIDANRSGAEEDFAFHRAILVSTHNPHFARFFDLFDSLIIPRQRLRLGAMPKSERQRYLRRIQREHHAILAAIRAGDPAAARRAARNHLGKSYARYQSLGPSPESKAPR
jgi:DNA-binding FadR family transcriptional regulator